MDVATAACHCCGSADGEVQRPPVEPILAEKPKRTREPQANAGVVNVYVFPETRTPLMDELVLAFSYFQIIFGRAAALPEDVNVTVI